MKIAQVCPYDYHRPGGVQFHIRDLASALADLGHETLVIAPAAGDVPDDPSVVHIGRCRSVAFNRTRFDVGLALGAEKRRLDRLLAERDFDIIHLHTPWTPFLPLQVLARSRAVNVATFHDVPPDTFTGNLTRIAFRLMSGALMRRLDAAIATSDAPAAHLARWTEILPPCVDLQRFTRNHPPFEQFRDGKVNILFLGRLDKRKGVMTLLAAYQRLCAEALPVRLIIVGDGDQAAEVKKFVARDAMPDVECVGFVDERDKPRWLASCDIFCSPALYGEGFGIVLVEAMASGKPVVAADNRGYHTVMRDAAAAWLTPPGDVAALHAKLRTLVMEPALRRDLGTWGRDYALQFDCRVVAPKIVAVYEQARQKKH